MSIGKRYAPSVLVAVLLGAVLGGTVSCREERGAPLAPAVASSQPEPKPEVQAPPPPSYVGTWNGSGKLQGIDPQDPQLRLGKLDVAPVKDGVMPEEPTLTITIDEQRAVVGVMEVGGQKVQARGVFLDDVARLQLVSGHLRGALILHKEGDVLRGSARLSSVTDELARSKHLARQGDFRLEKAP